VTEIGFYRLTRSTLDRALPRLLGKAFESGKRVILRCPDEARLEHLDRLLWTFSPDSFLPHGTATGEKPEQQPILLTTGEERPNAATLLVTLDAAPFGDLYPYERCLDLFDGTSATAVATARERWRWARQAGHRLVYWQQNERGGWVKAREEG
jgi:DNA polymerase-3 subunit chi